MSGDVEGVRRGLSEVWHLPDAGPPQHHHVCAHRDPPRIWSRLATTGPMTPYAGHTSWAGTRLTESSPVDQASVYCENSPTRRPSDGRSSRICRFLLTRPTDTYSIRTKARCTLGSSAPLLSSKLPRIRRGASLRLSSSRVQKVSDHPSISIATTTNSS